MADSDPRIAAGVDAGSECVKAVVISVTGKRATGWRSACGRPVASGAAASSPAPAPILRSACTRWAGSVVGRSV